MYKSRIFVNLTDFIRAEQPDDKVNATNADCTNSKMAESDF